VVPFVARNQRSGAGSQFTNVYLKNLSPSLTSEKFNELVAKATEGLAKITSPWLAVTTRTQEDGTKVEESKGFGFVNFETHEGALKALERFHDLDKMKEIAPELLHPKEDLYAGQAIPKNKRRKQQVPLNRNLYIKNIAETVSDKQLEELFQPFGEIVSAKIMVNEDTGVKRGFGFVCFKNTEDARSALTKMNGQHLEGKPLYVALAQPKELRKKQLEAQFAQRNMMPYYNAPFPVGPQRALMAARTLARGGHPAYGSTRGGFPPMMGRGGRQGGFPHPINHGPGDMDVRARLKTIPDEHKIQFLGDQLFGLVKPDEPDDMVARRIISTFLSSVEGMSLEDATNRLVSLCEDAEKRGEEIQSFKNPSK